MAAVRPDPSAMASCSGAQQRGSEAQQSTRMSEALEPLCWERVGDSTRQYVFSRTSSNDPSPKCARPARHEEHKLKHVEHGHDLTPLEFASSVLRSYFLPEGYPDTVTPSLAPYMRWRAVQYFFGGAMSVFTTRSLLHSLGIAKGRTAASGAIAVNWVIKDGAGRLGKLLFAGQGKRFDSDLKQMRFASSMLMGLGAGLELSTVAAPQFFLPLACAANVLKNIGAVTNTSTRAPIYKAFARKENLGDITAKGESISNMADLCGTGFGILLARQHPSVPVAFWTLSLGYLVASYNEIRSVHLPTMNRSRFSVAVKQFLQCGAVPSIPEVSRLERIIALPWATEKPVQIGARVGQAFETLEEFRMASEQCAEEKFVVNYRPSHRKAYVVLREGAGAQDVLKGAFRAHLMLHHLSEQGQHEAASQIESLKLHRDPAVGTACSALLLKPQHEVFDLIEWGPSAYSEAPLAALRQNWKTGWLRRNARERARQHALTTGDIRCALALSKHSSERLYDEFMSKASSQGLRGATVAPL